jgi:DNA invertase Pin-like site-specific DNA recombinase
MVKRAALYVRVSTDGQTMVNQQRELKAVAERHGWSVVEVFRDHGSQVGTVGRSVLDSASFSRVWPGGTSTSSP